MLEKKSSQRFIIFAAIILCLISIWYFWPTRVPDSKSSDRKLNKAIGSYGAINNQSKRQGLRDLSDRWPFSHRTDLSGDKASLEVCLIDAKTEDAIRVGSVSISKEPTKAIIFSDSVDQNGCVGLELDPGPWSIRLQVPEYASARILLEISSSHDHVRRIIRLHRTLMVKGIVLNASRQPQPDASVLFGVPNDSSSISPIASTHTSNSGDSISATVVNTSNSGEFSAELVFPKEEIMIYASKPPYGIAQVGPLDIHDIENKYLEIILPKEEEKFATISGRVLDSEMKPVSGASVEFIQSLIIPTINPALRGLDAESLQKIIRSDPAKAFIKQPEPKYSDPLHRFLSNAYFRPKTKSNEAGHFSLQVQIPTRGVLKSSADGLLPYQENSVNISRNISKDIYLGIPLIFSVQVKAFGGQTVLGTTARGVDTYLFRLDSQSDKYYSLGYPFTIFAEGIRYNQGITERKQITRFQKEIELTLGNCDVQGQVMGENELPINNIHVAVNAVGETEQENGLKISENVTYYSENGIFSLRHLIPGKASLSISGSSDEQTVFEKKTIELLLLEGITVKPIIVLKRK